jgi:DNA-binding NarL/FixJ family response regulator
MRVHWEKLGILGPVYRLVGRGFSNEEIASQLNINQDNVRRCVVWLMRFGEHSSRAELVLEAFANIPLNANTELLQ